MGLTDRLVVDPVFVLCATRSGSTLLRSILNSHSLIHAPHELHLNALRVAIERPYARKSFEQMSLSAEELQLLLWDRVLHGLLASSGKRVIVDKTPQNAADWALIHRGWPEARYIHLRRHPAAMLQSRLAANTKASRDHEIDLVRRYGDQLDAARRELPGPTVRYETLTADPTAVAQALCEYVGVPWEEAMVHYAVPDTGELRPGLGDWGAAIRSGHVGQARELSDDRAVELADMTARWGYS
ncbi:sulfotransferase family protein [Jatrophihabitans endophyticus]|uniref:sulfotransferase family protein n=1 Tax=Jatrophihabitans endophyticus TaxID=1206085 RepID=UPI0013563581|nr:sulfotransferase [Jatrophihabitans endophyticus]